MLKLKDIYVGDTDAKNELLMMTQSEVQNFHNSFTIPPSLRIDDYINGRNFYITGLKGTGKTALLRYISLEAKRSGVTSKFVLFKSDIKEGDKENLKRSCDTIVVNEGGSIKYQDDFEKVWIIFLHKVIVNHIRDNQLDIFQNDDAWKKYSALVIGADYGNKALGILEYFPRIKNGMLKFKFGDAPIPNIDIEFEDKDKSKVKLTTLTNAIMHYFGELQPSNKKMYVLVDELELNLGSATQYKRDIYLIRDLVVAVEHINRAMALVKFPVKVCCAIRKEVVTAIEASGKEIAKPIEDFGIEIVWTFPVGRDEAIYHPLISLLAKKIYVSERINGNDCEFNVTEIIKKYFPTEIYSYTIAEYLLHRTWFRPRDFSRMLKLIITQFGESTSGFQQIHFEQTQKNYATASWVEVAEELSAKYDKDAIRCVEDIFTGISKVFKFDDITEMVKKKKRFNARLTDFESDQKLAELVNDLFTIGFIGNIKPTRFRFRGDPRIDFDSEMQVHRALWPYFSISW
ncbi:P-loop ATPase, Sll1717 family [Humidesulfovibrio idahonensis]